MRHKKTEGGCAPAILGNSIAKATCAFAAARKASSSRLRASMCIEDLEAALRKQPGVRDCVVVPQQRDGNAEPLAALLLQEPSAAAALRTVDDANQSLAEYQNIRSWFIWPDP